MHTCIHIYIAKEAARSKETNYVFRRIPISAIYREAAEKGILKWQEQWEKTPKAQATKEYFPTVMDRIRIKLNFKANSCPIRTL